MKINDKGFFSEITFWKQGCNWGKKQLSFYNVLKKENIVISRKLTGEYNIGDIILVTEGFSVLALAQVKSPPIPSNTNADLVGKLEEFNVDDFDNVSYYKTDFFELLQNENFIYKLQKGIRRVGLVKIKKKATELWLHRKTAKNVDKRIMRLTWNTNNWETPIKHKWKPKHQGKTAVAHEKQYGFGHEEWLFNEQFRVDGYQYGYIRGVNGLSKEDEFIDQITLYTISDNSQRFLVGNLFNVEIIEGYEKEEKKIQKLINSYMPSMLQDLEEVEADYKHFEKNHLLPNVKFKWDEIELFNQPIPVDFLNGAEFNRFQPYHLDKEVEALLRGEFDKKVTFNFQSGKASNTTEYTKSTSSKETTVKRRHGEITDDLYDYLKNEGYKNDSISVEKTRVGGAIVDVALEHSEGFDLFEVKTSNTALKNIRQALGQIFEYALLDKEIKCNRLVIVGPAELSEQEQDYFNRLKSLIKIKLEYWGYRSQEKVIENKFIIK